MRKFIMFLSLSTLLSGCVTISGINEDFRKLDQAWAQENDQYKAAHSPHPVSVGRDQTFSALKQTFVDLQMPIDKESLEDGFILSKNQAPHPLSTLQWQEVRDIENPKLRKQVGGLISIQKNPEKYFVTYRASIEADGDRSNVILDYYLEMPDYEDMGIIPTREAPPHAFKLVSEMFFAQLDSNIEAAN